MTPKVVDRPFALVFWLPSWGISASLLQKMKEFSKTRKNSHWHGQIPCDIALWKDTSRSFKLKSCTKSWNPNSKIRILIKHNVPNSNMKNTRHHAKSGQFLDLDLCWAVGKNIFVLDHQWLSESYMHVVGGVLVIRWSFFTVMADSKTGRSTSQVGK